MVSRGNLESAAKETQTRMDDIKVLAEEGEKIISQTYDKGRQIFSQAVAGGEKAVESGYHEVKDKVSLAMDSTTSLIKKYPIQSVLAGFGVGCLLGLVIKQSRKSGRREEG